MGMSKSVRRPAFMALFLLAFGGMVVLPRQTPAQDPSGRVARLNFIQGAVSMQPAGTQDWVDANPNRPLTTGDNLWSGDDGRGELHVGSASMRLSNDTGISFLNLNDQAVQIQLAQGTLNIRLRRLDAGEAYEIDTPNLAFSLLREGEYRINVDPDGGTTAITVMSGAGEVTGGGSAYSLDPGQQGIFSGTSPLSFDNEYAPQPDDFDNWCLSRDQREDQSMSARYISRDVIGYDDLDAHGTWRTDPMYGPVWVPSGVPYGWAPYHQGHWAYIAPWGWTWVDDMPWGFAPFHYGRWAYASGGWVWAPGSVAVVVGHPYVRPMYAPALVAFVGGGGFSVSIGLGGGMAGVAWFPLGPRDVWVPSYHCSPAYVQNLNISNSTVINRTQITNVYNTTTINNINVTNITYMNQNSPGAVTAVPRDAFASGRPVAAAAVKVTPQQIQHPQVVQRTVVAAPRNLVPMAAKTASAKPPAALANRTIVTKMKPSPQVVPIGQKTAIASSKLVKAAPPAPPARKMPPPNPANRPAAAAPGRPVPAGVRPATPATNRPVMPPPSKAVTPATNKPVMPPAGKEATTPNRPVAPPPKTVAPRTNPPATTPAKRPVTPPANKEVTTPNRPFTPPPKAVEPRTNRPAATPNRTITPPANKEATRPANRPVTPPPRAVEPRTNMPATTPNRPIAPPPKAVEPRANKPVTPLPSKAVTPPPKKAETPPPGKPAKEQKKTKEPEH